MDLGITILDHAVFQRTQNNCSSHPFRGSCAVDGPVLMTVRSDNGILSAWKNVPVGFARQGQLQGNIEGLPAGGPYELTLAIENSREKVSFHDIYVGDVWILAGQSNMAGFAFMPSMSTPHPAVKCFYMNNRWGVAEDPLHDVMRAAAPVHGGDPSLPRPKKFLRGPGPGLPFALAMYEKTQVPQGVIACAHGGTSMSQWDPDKKSQGDYSLYGAL